MNILSPAFATRPLAFLAASLATGNAALVYVDATYGGNTRNALTSSTTDWSVDPAVTPNAPPDNDNLWGQRTSGPAAVLFGTNGWQAWSTESAPTIVTRVSGLDLNSTYTGIRLYFTGKPATGGSDEWFIDASVNGTDYTTYQDGAAANAVDASNGGIGTSITPGTGDTRYYVDLPDAMTNGSGQLDIYVRPGTGANSRTVYDGIAYNNVAVPEPASFALVGLGGLFALVRRRRVF